jgi:CheY-like chemotaxis protein
VETRSPEVEEIRTQLRRMLDSRFFRQSPRLSRLLTFTVDQAVEGSEQRLKEYSIALEVFGKPESFDPRLDSAVRVAARQLRAKIDAYYLTDGAQDTVLIRYRPGEYMPRFYHRGDAAALDPDPSPEGILRPALVVGKERASIRTLTECLDAMSYPIARVVDSAEKALELLPAIGACVIITGLALTGPMNGTELMRCVQNQGDTAVVALIPCAVEMQMLQELLSAGPDSLLYEPVRASDLKTAVRIAVAHRNAAARARDAQGHPQMASCA